MSTEWRLFQDERRKALRPITECAFFFFSSIAAAFTRIVNSLVSDIILPFVALLPLFDRNLPQKFLVLRPGPNYDQGGYNTIQQAEADGAITMAYGYV